MSTDRVPLRPVTTELAALAGGVTAATIRTELLGARLAFERAATASDPRIAVIDAGGADHLMFVETDTAPSTDLDPLGRAVGEIETLPTQWTATARDPDGRPLDIRAHRPRGDWRPRSG
ncbi:MULTISPECIES: hypothetical protein [unclassified Streptomyces]|uniref:hypothetical protein n=1 Tax=unclassified Streptomyces TaxID=2593676 RepID=UPI00278BE6C4|nr:MULTISPECIES: hypothetical protein [unclassified Streptomyces]